MRTSIRGFTLVEVLVAMALMGLILGALYSGLYGVSRSWSRSEVIAGNNDRQRLAIHVLRRLISQAAPITLTAPQGQHLLFSGEKDHMRWVAPLPSHAGGAGLYWSELRLQPDATGNAALALVYEPLSPEVQWDGPLDLSTAESVALVPDVAGLEIEYFGATEADEPPRWHPTWISISQLPLLVRLTARNARSEPAFSPLAITLRVQPQRGQPQWSLAAAH